MTGQALNLVPTWSVQFSVPGSTQPPIAEALQDRAEIAAILTPALRGPAGPAGSLASPPIPFAFGDASPRTVLIVPSPTLILSVRVKISTAFNGTAPSFKLGTASQPESLMSPAMLDLATIAEYESNPQLTLSVAENVFLTLLPGAGCTQGAGWVVFEQIPAL